MQPSIQNLPKAELHLHIEGTFEPELIFEIAKRNSIELKYKSVEELKKAYEFTNLQSFLDIYYEAMKVLRNEQDFTDLANAYLERAQSQGVVHVEMFFDPQAHTQRGVAFETVVNGLSAAVSNSEKNYGITSALIMCFLRDMSAESAMETLENAIKLGSDKIIAVGLDSAEVGNPPSKFAGVFAHALKNGFKTVAHAGEEGPPEYVWEAINLLRVSRVDHGVRSMEDPKLVQHLVDTKLPLTVCPLSNVKLRVFKNMQDHTIRKMLELGVRATVNSDDPAYFGGYVGDNFDAIHKALNMTDEELLTLARNSFDASFITDARRKEYLAKLEKHAKRLAGDKVEEPV